MADSFDFDTAPGAAEGGDSTYFGAEATADSTPFGADGGAFEAAVPVDQFGAAAAAVPAAPVLLAAAPEPAALSAQSAEHNPLVEFNKKFRAICEEKDAKERDAKAARKAAGKAALKKLLGDRHAVVEGRQGKNREDEAAAEREAMDALEGESWGRVVSLIDIHGVAAAAAEASGKKGKAAASASGGEVVPDVGRHKDVLISLKANPLPPATGGM